MTSFSRNLEKMRLCLPTFPITVCLPCNHYLWMKFGLIWFVPLYHGLSIQWLLSQMKTSMCIGIGFDSYALWIRSYLFAGWSISLFHSLIHSRVEFTELCKGCIKWNPHSFLCISQMPFSLFSSKKKVIIGISHGQNGTSFEAWIMRYDTRLGKYDGKPREV